MENKTERWCDFYKIVKLANQTVKGIWFPGEKQRIGEHSHVVISNPWKSSVEVVSLVSGSLQWLEH